MAIINNDRVSPERLAIFLRYDPDSGRFWWRSPGIEHFRKKHAFYVFSGQHAGKETMLLDRGNGYFCCRLDGHMLSAHRAAWCLYYGEWPIEQIDHINMDRKDNRIDNLRIAIHGENNMNRPMLSSNTSGVKGVSFHKASGLWRASVRHYGDRSEKYFTDKYEAARWRDETARNLQGEFAR